MRSLGVVVTLLAVLTSTSVATYAQTASTSTVSGTVYDTTRAVVPKASVELTDVATNAKRTTTSGGDGVYVFVAVPPGDYKLTISAPGFRQSVVSGVTVEVGKAALVNVTVELGEVTQVVEVKAGVGTELQTLDSSVGNVFDSKILKNMPTLTRDATQLLLLQPMTGPGFNPGSTAALSTYGEGNTNGGGVAGARMDQNTFMLDGGDATSNMEGGGGYNTGFIATPRAAVPTPVESLEEFRVQTNNQNASFSRSGGGEVQMVTKRGTNAWHGAGYWYHQNDELNANDWFRNRRGRTNPELRDNRAGGRLGGPIWKDRTFFMVHEEERHFFTPVVFQRLVPTAAEKLGILKFKDASGVVRAYNLNPVAVTDPSAGPGDNDPQVGTPIAPSGSPGALGCGSLGTSACDPRASTGGAISPVGGLSPAIAAEWATLPLPNDFSGGDGLRSAFFTSITPNLINEHFAVLRLDHKISSKWNFNAVYRYSTTSNTPPNIQEDIGGIAPGCTKGVPCPLASRPLQPRYLVASLTGQITPNLTNEFHFNWLRHWWAWQAPGARIPVIPTALSDTRLQIWRESRVNGMVPINVDTQKARQRTWNGRDFTWIDNLSWTKGKHLWQFGGRAQRQHFLHLRDDKVVGGLTTPIYFVVRGGDFSNIPVGSAFRPPSCSSTVTTNCLKSTDRTNWTRAYISALGMVDTASQVFSRDATFKPNPPGAGISQDAIVDSYELHFADTWRVTPSFTFTYGLSWGVQLPPFETRGLQTMMVDANSGQIITADQLLGAKALAAANGDVVNPTLGYVPISATGRKYPYDPDYTNFGPRLAAAWNPSFSGGPLGAIFGSGKTVLRGGWSRVFDRLNGVGIVLTPALGVGFGDLSVCRTPDRTGACGSGGTPLSNFRIGVDGNHISVPPLPAIPGTPIIIPGQGGAIPITAGALPNSVFENRDFRIDPRRQIGGSDVVDFSIQRQLPWNMLMEVGWVGRWSRDLYANIELNHVPYMFKPKGVNQTFAQAFDLVDAQVRAGVDPSMLTKQPWFEAMLGPGGTALAGGLCGMGVHGVGLVWAAIESSFVNGPGGTPLPLTAINRQVASMDWAVSNSTANYQAGFVTLRKRAGDLTFDFNYTLSHSLDTFGVTQENTCAVTDAFNLRRNFGPSLFDRRHVFNLLVNYDLPFGKGKKFATGGIADRVFSGWSVSGIYTGATGLPDMVFDDAACGTEFGNTSANGDSIGLLLIKPGVIVETRFNNPTLSPSGFGAASAPSGKGVPNAFANPDAVVANFRYPTFADNTLGFGAIRGPFRWNVDLNVAKTTRITERLSIRLDAQLINAFNHANVLGSGSDSFFSSQPGADISCPAAFGVPSNQFVAPRYLQLGIRFEF
jgi:hypothetical protein